MPPMERSENPLRTGVKFGLYDWASSPLPALHATFIFPVYFATSVMPDGGSAAWAWMNAAAALIIAFLAPLLGVVADHFASRKTIMLVLTLIASLAASALWWVTPDVDAALLALIVSAIVIVASELSFVAYNALLPQLAERSVIGRVSGVAWGMGYFGAIICLVLMLAVFVLPETPPFGLDPATLEHIRITMPLAGLWFALFAVPFFLLIREGPRTSKPFLTGLKQGWGAVRSTPGLLRFLLARMLFADALVTLFAMGGIFAARVHGFSQTDVLIFAIILNITAGIGALVGGKADDHLGSLMTIRWALILMILLGGAAIIAQSPPMFWVVGSLLGLFVGPLQASSRSMVARLAPDGTESRVFGFMMLTGKATAFLGPFFYGLLVTITDSDRVGMTVVIVLMALGLVLLPRR